MTRPKTSHKHILLLVSALCITTFALTGRCAVFPVDDPSDEVLKQIGVDEKTGAQLPLGAAFTDSGGGEVLLGDYFGGTPVILTLNFYECPMLCPLTFRNLADTFSEMGGLKLGRDYRVVTVSFNPDETYKLASEKAAETYAMLNGVDKPEDAWIFLVGSPPEIDALTATAGYKYKRVDGSYAHPAVIIVATPDGRISRYLYGIKLAPMDLRLSLIEASGGRIGPSSALNRVLLFCYHYDRVGKKYSLAAVNIITGLGIFTLLAVGGLLLVMWLRERRGKRA